MNGNIQFPRPLVAVGECVAACRNRDRGRPPGPETEDRLSIWFGVPRERWKASRLSYHLNCATIERRPKEGEANFVLYTCDNKWCVNPAHLYLGSKSDNMRDMMARHPTVRENRRKARIGKTKAPRSTPVTPEERAKRSASMKRAWERAAPALRDALRKRWTDNNPRSKRA